MLGWIKKMFGNTESKTQQNQKAGDGANQYQIGTVVMGTDEKRVREIVNEMLSQALAPYFAQARYSARERVNEFEDNLIQKMTKKNILDAFADPSFQIILMQTLKAAASTERPADHDMLSELLTQRFEKGNDRNTRTAIDFAVEIVDKISEEALVGLTVFHAIITVFPMTGNIMTGLDILNDLFGKILLENLPKGKEWLEHLDILKAVRIANFWPKTKLLEYYPNRVNGYACVGIEKNSENHNKALSKLIEVQLPPFILIEHVLNPNFVRLNISNKENDTATLSFPVPNFQEIQINLNQDQKNIIDEVYNLYNNDVNLKNDMITKFMSEWDKREHLRAIHEWWDDLKGSIEITSVGRVLANANAQRCDPNFPPLN
jgi:hypothetical protein